MYIFPNPLTDEDLVGSVSLIVEAENLPAEFPQLSYVMTKIKRRPTGLEYPFYVYQLE